MCGKNTKKILMKLKLKAELIEKDFHKRTKIESCQKTFLREKKIKNCAKTRLSFPSCTSCIISKGWGGNQHDSPLFWPNSEDTCPRGFNEPLPSFDPPPPLEGFGGDLTSSPFLLLSSMTWLTGLDSGSVYYWQLVTYLITLLHVCMCVKVGFWLHLLSDYLHVHLKIRIVVYTIAGTIITNSFFMRWFVVKISPIPGNDTTPGKLFCNLIPV